MLFRSEKSYSLDLMSSFKEIGPKLAQELFDTYSYHGFDPKVTLQVIKATFHKNQADLLATLIAVEQNGPNKCFILPHLASLMRKYGFKKKATDAKDLTPGRVLTVCAPLYVLATQHLPKRKRFTTSKVPAALQFPASTSIYVPPRFEGEFKRFHVKMHDALQTNKQNKEPFNDQLWEIQRQNSINVPELTKLIEQWFEAEGGDVV